MGINLPNPRNAFMPIPPPVTNKDVPVIIRYLNRLKIALEKEFSSAWENTYSILSTGASGVITNTTTSVTVVNGIITEIV